MNVCICGLRSNNCFRGGGREASAPPCHHLMGAHGYRKEIVLTITQPNFKMKPIAIYSSHF